MLIRADSGPLIVQSEKFTGFVKECFVTLRVSLVRKQRGQSALNGSDKVHSNVDFACFFRGEFFMSLLISLKLFYLLLLIKFCFCTDNHVRGIILL